MSSPESSALLAAYREVSEVDDQPPPEAFERLEAEIEAEAQPSRRVAAWLVAGIAVAASAAAVVSWPRPELLKIESDAGISTAVDRARAAVPTSAPVNIEAPPVPREAPRETPTPPVETAPQPAPATRAKAPPAAAPATQDNLLQELALLRKARQAMLRDDLGAARAALRSHRKTFASGQLAEDRDALWVILRCREGSKNSSRAAFEAAHPSSHHLVAIRAACEKK